MAKNKPKLVVLTGAGISAESGLKTFRDSGGLWENFDVMEVASIDGWHKNQKLVLEFYNARRKQLKDVTTNAAHMAIAEMEKYFETTIITQNVDDLHERAGSRNIIHLHGELKKVRSIEYPNLIYLWDGDLQTGDLCEKGHQLRPHIVWFGEMVPKLEDAIIEISEADKVLIVGTSMQVYPAASLIAYAPGNAEVYYIDPNPQISYELSMKNKLKVIQEKATVGVPRLLSEWTKKSLLKK
ncbi:MAG TPA: NAD-dependent deacylase [Saprospiraceae bacterium]|nr:NAD-dependent deacylase [Saprospiraceae bacterium]